MYDIIISRLKLNKDENKFEYLYKSFKRVDNSLYTKQKIVEGIEDLKNAITDNFILCLIYPDTFNLSNNYVPHVDNNN